MRIGLSQFRTFISGIRGVTTGNANAIPVMIDSDGQLGTMSSSRRFKHEIKPMDTVSQAILSLKPVTFNYKSDNTNTPQFGLIAEDVAAVNPDLVVREQNGQIYTVRYDAVNAMLLNEFLKAHIKMEAQQKQIDDLTARLEQQAAQIQKVERTDRSEQTCTASGQQSLEPIGVGTTSNAKNTSPFQFFCKRDAAASQRPDFSPGATVVALAASVRPHNASDSDRCDGNPMATIRGGIIGWYKNRILTRRLS